MPLAAVLGEEHQHMERILNVFEEVTPPSQHLEDVTVPEQLPATSTASPL